MNSTVITFDGGQILVADTREFKTGSRGYYGSGKIVIDGKRYQVSCNVVEIGSKPGSEVKAKNGKSVGTPPKAVGTQSPYRASA